METRAEPRTLAGSESVQRVEVAASGTSSKIIGTAGQDADDQRQRSDTEAEVPCPGIDGAQTPVIQPETPSKPQLTLTPPDSPLRYIPIHVWPEHLNKVEPRTGRRYCPKRSRTISERRTSSPLVQEFQWTEDEEEDRALSDTEIMRSGSAGSVETSPTTTTSKRWAWGFILFGPMQNPLPKRPKPKEKQSHSTFSRKSLPLSPLRLGHRPQGVKRRESRENTDSRA